MSLGLGTALWGIVVPLAETNLSRNPSYEYGTVGAFAIQGASLGSSSQYQRYGAWSLSVTPSSNGTSGAVAGTFTTGNGTLYNVSVWARVESGVPFRVAIGDSSGLNLTSGSVTATGGGTWHWYNCAIIEAAQGTRSVVIQKTSGNSVQPFYVDGVKISPWADGIDRVTTYFDGDTGGGTWLGAAHANISVRTGQYRSGGSMVALADLGLQVNDMLGVGVPPIEMSTQSYAVIDGAQFQRQRTAPRKFSLTAKPIVGTSLADFHVTRRTLWDVFKPDLVTPQQAVRFFYVGGQGTQFLNAYYDSGLELGNMDGPIAENAAVSFVATDPYWYADTMQGTALTNRVYLGSVNFFAWRDSAGRWGTLGSNGTTIMNVLSATHVRDLVYNDAGTLFYCGQFGTTAGTLTRNIGLYYPATNTFGTLGPGTLNGVNIYSMAQSPQGTLYVGGDYTNIAGTVAGGFGFWNGAWGSFPGALSGDVRAVLLATTGTIFLGANGPFSPAGSTANSFAFWYSGSFGTTGAAITGGAALVTSLAEGLDGRIFIGGNYTSANGTTANSTSFWKDGAFGTMQGGVNNQVNSLLTLPNGYELVGGAFTDKGLYIASFNGVAFSQLGAGITSPAAISPNVFGMFYDSFKQETYVGGRLTNVGSVQVNDGFAVWNGAVWRSADWDIADTAGTVRAFAQTPDGTTYIAGRFFGTARAAAITTTVSAGRANTYPTMVLQNTTSGTARIYQLINTTTNDVLAFNLRLIAGEVVTLVTEPNRRSFTSNFRGNIFGAILPGSNLSSFKLVPGTNTLSFFSDNDSLTSVVYWQPRGWSADSGTVF